MVPGCPGFQGTAPFPVLGTTIVVTGRHDFDRAGLGRRGGSADLTGQRQSQAAPSDAAARSPSRSSQTTSIYLHLPDAAVILCWRPAPSCARHGVTWQVSAPVLALIILRLVHPDEAMRIFGSESEFRKATGRVNIQPLGRLYDCVKWPDEVRTHTCGHGRPTACTRMQESSVCRAEICRLDWRSDYLWPA